MTGKELQKLRRQELLQLLLEQSKEVAQLQAEHGDADQQAQQLEDSNERLSAKLEEKDALNGKLQGRLDQKMARIRQLEQEMEAWRQARKSELERAGSVAEAALSLNGLFEIAQLAAEQYLYNIRLRCSGREGTLTRQPDGKGGLKNDVAKRNR